MSWFRAAALALLLAGCGFSPVYGPNSDAARLQNRVLVEEVQSREGYLLVRQVEERIGRGVNPSYGLGLTVSVEEESLAIDESDDILRFNLVGVAEYALRAVDSGQVITSGKVESFTGYSATGTFVATRAAKDDALERLMKILADQIVVRLQVTRLEP